MNTHPLHQDFKNPPSYEKYKKWVQDQGIRTKDEFNLLDKSKFPPGYSRRPDYYYRKRGIWKGWNDLFGTQSIRLADPPSYEEYKKWVQDQGIKTQTEFKLAKSKLPPNYPKDPQSFYGDRGTWKRWHDFCGTESYRLLNPPSYEKYKKWVQDQGVKSQKELRGLNKSKFPPGYSKRPDYYYRKLGTWKGFNDLFGTEQYFLLNAPSYAEYKKWVQKQGIKTEREWRRFDKSKFPSGYPKEPSKFYKKEYKGMGDMLGTGTVAPQNIVFLPPIEAKIEARKVAKKLGIKTQKDWTDAYHAGKISKNLPGNLYNVYKRDAASKKRLREKSRK
uniref:Uncharacterized protein n=1 Tax=uncultured marine thaumarchaeote KM3_85_E11 TaxID=1456317 RepID=A0A075HX36_9ARCH|nr:hypothetical protein [uncultured marine thaumarchaeote KM3_85_E11]